MKAFIKPLVFASVVCLVGCSSTSDRPWAVWERLSAKPQAMGSSEAHPRFLATRLEEHISSLTLHFDFDNSRLTTGDKAQLDELVMTLEQERSGLIRLEGYTDERGSREYNVALGWRRAKAVSQYLIQQGVAPQRLDLVSYGPEKPVSSAHGETAWRLNRRVELAIGEYQ